MKPKPTLNFAGFTLPQGTFLPPEIQAILPLLKSLGVLKVLLAALFDASTVGQAPRPLSLADLMALTGLSKQTVITARQDLVDMGCFVTWHSQGQTYYALATREGGLTVRPPVVVTTTTTTTNDDIQQLPLGDLKTRMVALGVTPSSADRLLKRYAPGRIDEVLDYVEQQLHKCPGRIRRPGGFIYEALSGGWVMVPPKQSDPEGDAIDRALALRQEMRNVCMDYSESLNVSTADALRCFQGVPEQPRLPCADTCPLEEYADENP